MARSMVLSVRLSKAEHKLILKICRERKISLRELLCSVIEQNGHSVPRTPLQSLADRVTALEIVVEQLKTSWLEGDLKENVPRPTSANFIKSSLYGAVLPAEHTKFIFNATLHTKLEAQLARGEPLRLTHDEIDEWRNQWRYGPSIPVELLAYKGRPIKEEI